MPEKASLTSTLFSGVQLTGANEPKKSARSRKRPVIPLIERLVPIAGTSPETGRGSEVQKLTALFIAYKEPGRLPWHL